MKKILTLISLVFLLAACSQVGTPTEDELSAQLFGLKQKIIPSLALNGDAVGSSVATYGDIMVIGSPKDDVNGKLDAGSVYVYQLNSTGNWSFVKKLKSVDGGASDYFGTGVAIYSDMVVVGSPGHSPDVNGNGTIECSTSSFDPVPVECNIGALYIYQRNQGGINQWGLVKKINTKDNIGGGRLGGNVAVTKDAIFATDGKTTVGPMVRFFQKDHGGLNNWGEFKKVEGYYPCSDSPLSVSGNTLAIAGSQYVALYQRNEGGANQWGNTRILSVFSSPSRACEAPTSVVIRGNVLAVGGFIGNGGFYGPGQVLIFYRNLEGIWNLIKTLIAPNSVLADNFGYRVAMSGGTLVSYTPGGGTATPAAYVFGRNQGGTDNWGLVKKIVPPDANLVMSIAMSGQSVIAGVPRPTLAGPGAVYLYE